MAMIDLVKKFFGGGAEAGDPSDAPKRDVRVATCALFIEMATIDDEFDESEMRLVVAVLRDKYGLSGEHADELMATARDQLEKGIDLWRFTNLINKNYSAAEKFEVVTLLWELVYADGRLSEHENYLMRRLGRMLRLSHSELINAKLKVLNDVRGS